jgi:hypothetical protein
MRERTVRARRNAPSDVDKVIAELKQSPRPEGEVV